MFKILESVDPSADVFMHVIEAPAVAVSDATACKRAETANV
jgi:hypothetical protein